MIKNNMTNMNKCFQCGGKTIIISEKKEIINNSVVITTKSVCADPDCQKRIDKYKKDRIVQIKEIELNREIRVKEFGYQRRQNQITLGPSRNKNKLS